MSQTARLLWRPAAAAASSTASALARTHTTHQQMFAVIAPRLSGAAGVGAGGVYTRGVAASALAAAVASPALLAAAASSSRCGRSLTAAPQLAASASSSSASASASACSVRRRSAAPAPSPFLVPRALSRLPFPLRRNLVAVPLIFLVSTFASAAATGAMGGRGDQGGGGDRYRADGVRITHDPYAAGMEDKYGAEGETDSDGFDPYADSVGAGIYGGAVKRDPTTGEVLVGAQYQGHNARPGPVYSGAGYSAVSKALKRGEAALGPLFDADPAAANEITTGGARPLHMCGMSRDNQMAAAYVIARGGDVEALDTYGMTPLHRMASNNLPIGAEALLAAGANPNNKGKIGETPMAVARAARGREVMEVLARHGGK